MKELKEQVLESDLIHAENCLQGYIHYKDRDSELAKYYWDTLQDFIERKKIVDGLSSEEKILNNAIWMLENGALKDLVEPLSIVDVLIKTSVRLKLVRQTKAIVSGNPGALLQAL